MDLPRLWTKKYDLGITRFKIKLKFLAEIHLVQVNLTYFLNILRPLEG